MNGVEDRRRKNNKKKTGRGVKTGSDDKEYNWSLIKINTTNTTNNAFETLEIYTYEEIKLELIRD